MEAENLRTVHEVSKLTGVSIRTLQYYDKIGLLPPASYTEAGYRLYDDTALERLQQILLFRELEFPLREIQRILDSPGFDRSKALDQQIELLTLKKEHIENLLALARGIRKTGGKHPMNFEAFDTRKMEEYAAQAKASWGQTPEYTEYEQRSKGRTKEETKDLTKQMMDIFAEFGAIRDGDPGSKEAQKLVRKLQRFITEHFYTCSDQVLCGIGTGYGGGGEMNANIDRYAGEGTGVFAMKAVQICCGGKQ